MFLGFKTLFSASLKIVDRLGQHEGKISGCVCELKTRMGYKFEKDETKYTMDPGIYFLMKTNK